MSRDNRGFNRSTGRSRQTGFQADRERASGRFPVRGNMYGKAGMVSGLQYRGQCVGGTAYFPRRYGRRS